MSTMFPKPKALNDMPGEIIGVMISTDMNAVAIKLSNGTAVTFDARWPEDVMTVNASDFVPPYWQPMHV